MNTFPCSVDMNLNHLFKGHMIYVSTCLSCQITLQKVFVWSVRWLVGFSCCCFYQFVLPTVMWVHFTNPHRCYAILPFKNSLPSLRGLNNILLMFSFVSLSYYYSLTFSHMFIVIYVSLKGTNFSGFIR